jgi:hypothetical protein
MAYRGRVTIFWIFERGTAHPLLGPIYPQVIAALRYTANRLRWPVVDDSRSEGKEDKADTRFGAVGPHRGCKAI